MRLSGVVGVIALALAVWTVAPQSEPGSQAGALTIPACTYGDVQVMLIFDGPGNADGTVFLQNVSSHNCSLSGRPTIRVFDRAGQAMNRSESLYHWDPPLPRPTSPILLASSSSSVNESALADLNWCGFGSVYKRIDIRFAGWKRPVVVLSTSEPEDFVSPACKIPSERQLAVDYVRELGPKGIPGIPPTVRVTPSIGLHIGQKVVVTVSGFWPDGKFWLSECASVADVQGKGCGLQLAAQPFGIASDTGTGTYTFVVKTRAAVKPYSTRQTVPCKDQCVLMATAGANLTAYAPLRFAVP